MHRLPSRAAAPVRRTTTPRGFSANSVTDQTVELPGRTLHFKATAGSIPLNDAESGALQAEIAYVAYVMGSPADNRPVTFLFNGGPGRRLGLSRPRRCRPVAAAAQQHHLFDVAYARAKHPETWLDFTDLGFIDPVGTGYSRIAASGDNVRRQFYSVDGDANALAVMIRKWIEKTVNSRTDSGAGRAGKRRQNAASAEHEAPQAVPGGPYKGMRRLNCLRRNGLECGQG